MSSSCDTKPTLIMACSGAADVGELADRSARKAARQGIGRMYCLAGIGAGLESYVTGAKNAGWVIAIDGCPTACASKCLQRAEVEPTLTIQLADLGFKKGSSPASEDAVAQVVEAIGGGLAALPRREPPCG